MNRQLAERASKMVKTSEPGERYADFKEEIKGKDATITLHNGTVIKCRIVDVRPYWLKIVTNGSTLYVNKAYITLIEPA